MKCISMVIVEVLNQRKGDIYSNWLGMRMFDMKKKTSFMHKIFSLQ